MQGDICAPLWLAPSGPSLRSPSLLATLKSVSLELSELEAAARALLFSSLSFLFLVVPADVKSPESHFLSGGRLAAGPSLHLQVPRKDACKQVEAWSLNVSAFQPEVGSASAGQTSFAGVEKGGRGSNGGGTSETLSCWERQGKGRGEGTAGGGSWGLRVPSSPPPRAQPPRSLQLRLIAAPASCAHSAGHQRELSASFPNFAALRREPPPSGEPLAHLFSSVVFFFFFFSFPFGCESRVWSLAFVFVCVSPLQVPEAGKRAGEKPGEDAQGKFSPRADYKLIGAKVEKGDIMN